MSISKVVDGLRPAAAALLASLIVGCATGLPGQPEYRAAITILNRTTQEVTLESGQGGQIRLAVPACGEATRDDFPVNWWTVTAPGRDTFHSGGGVSGQQTFLIVTTFVTQQDARPEPLPPCEGLLQPAQQ